LRNKLLATATTLCSALAVSASAPTIAQAAHHGHRVLVCNNESTRHGRNTGTLVGAIAGGLAGNALSHGGGKTGGTLIGAGVGAVAGHQIAKHNGDRRHCHYEYR
jgi:uncharacterized protein YcfJ